MSNLKFLALANLELWSAGYSLSGHPVEFPLYILFQADSDFVNPIDFIARYQINIDPKTCSDMPCPILDKHRTPFDRHQVTYFRECASDSSCKPDLKVQSKLVLPR